MLLHNLDNSFLATYRPARLRFTESDDLPEAIRPVWDALRAQQSRLALQRGYELLRGSGPTRDERAALLAALASVEWDNGVASTARRLANESIELVGGQFMAYRVLLTIYMSEREFGAARTLLASVEAAPDAPAWDEPLSETDQHLLRAALAWMTHEWDLTAAHLGDAYPHGVRSMPAVLQEDWFRLAFYREKPSDAAGAAEQLIRDHSSEKADVLIQTLVRQGWHKEALALYRRIYDQDPSNELLRRRVVGLCIREGEVKEARRLMELGALRLAV